MKLLRSLLLGIVVLLAAVLAGKNLIAKTALTGGVKMITGLDTKLEGVQVGLFSTAVGVKGLQVMNPPQFSERVMLDMPELFIDYNLSDILKGKIHLEVVRLNLKEFNVSKSADSQLNLNSIEALSAAKKPAEGKPAKPEGKPAAPINLQIDLLELSIGTVTYTDYTKNPPAKQTFAVNINERHEHITNPYTFAGLLVSRALMRTSIAQLANFDLRGLQSGVETALKDSASQFLKQGGVLGDALQKDGLGVMQRTGKGTVDAAGNASQDAVDAAGDAVKGATGAVKKLFGN